MAVGIAPKGNSLSEEDVCARVRDSVLEQRLAPGTKLTEESLCAVFGVGRTTVRRAFLLLKRDNIMYAFLEQLVFQTSLIVALYGPKGAGPNCSGEDHKNLVDALEQNDQERANSLLIEHLSSIEAQLSFAPKKPFSDLQTIFLEVQTA